MQRADYTKLPISRENRSIGAFRPVETCDGPFTFSILTFRAWNTSILLLNPIQRTGYTKLPIC
jgi:hypothetical protein